MIWTLRVEEQYKQTENPEVMEKILDGFILRGKGEKSRGKFRKRAS